MRIANRSRFSSTWSHLLPSECGSGPLRRAGDPRGVCVHKEAPVGECNDKPGSLTATARISRSFQKLASELRVRRHALADEVTPAPIWMQPGREEGQAAGHQP